MGRLVYFIVLSSLIVSASSISASEVQAVQLEREAERFEKQARIELDPDRQIYYQQLAKVRRDDALRERKRHYLNEKSVQIKNNSEWGTNLSKNRVFVPSQNDVLDGTWELSAFAGAGAFSSDRGNDLLGYSSALGVKDSKTNTRNSLIYDNIPYYNNQGNPTGYATNPFGFKLRYTNNEDRFGFQIDIRTFRKDTSFLGWNYFTNDLSGNAIQNSKYNWVESKINYFYQEELSYDQTIEFIFGIRNQGTLVEQNTNLPFVAGTRSYNETTHSLGPNLGLSYKKNFYGVFLFSAGLELSVLGGILEYDNLVLRANNTTSGISNFSKLELQDPIFLSTSVIEIYTKYDFLIGDKDRIGIGLTGIQSNRITNWDKNIPLIISNDSTQLIEDYTNFFLRNSLYNQESNDSGRSLQIRFIHLEFTHVI